jgi:hypothetical protein
MLVLSHNVYWLGRQNYSITKDEMNYSHHRHPRESTYNNELHFVSVRETLAITHILKLNPYCPLETPLPHFPMRDTLQFMLRGMHVDAAQVLQSFAL